LVLPDDARQTEIKRSIFYIESILFIKEQPMSDSIYLAMPKQLQKLALTAYGRKLYRERFIGGIPTDYNIDLTPFRTLNEVDFHNQTRRFRELIAHCKDFVPYYANPLKNVDVDRLNLDDLNKIVPVLTKADIKRDPELFVSIRPDHKGKLRTANTSGSSGTPLTVKYTDEARRINYHFYEKALSLFGCNYRSKSTTFAGRILYKTPGKNPDRYDHYNNTQYLSSYFISDSTVEHYVAALNRWAPEFIDTYPSALVELLKLAKQHQLNFTFSPKCVLTSSETLSLEARKLIESMLNTTVIDHYGCTEMTINAVSIGAEYFSDPMFSVLEFEHQFEYSYELITTGLLNFGMPLLRYKIGDLVEKSSSKSYGFDAIDGRADDVIITPEGKRVGRMDPAFKGIEGIDLAQIIQEKHDRIIVLVVQSQISKGIFNPTQLIENIKERTSNSIEVNITYVDNIPKGANGKFKSVISKLK